MGGRGAHRYQRVERDPVEVALSTGAVDQLPEGGQLLRAEEDVDVAVDDRHQQIVRDRRQHLGQRGQRIATHHVSRVGQRHLHGMVKARHRADLLGHAGGQPRQHRRVAEVQRLDVDAHPLGDARHPRHRGQRLSAAELGLEHDV